MGVLTPGTAGGGVRGPNWLSCRGSPRGPLGGFGWLPRKCLCTRASSINVVRCPAWLWLLSASLPAPDLVASCCLTKLALSNTNEDLGPSPHLNV